MECNIFFSSSGHVSGCVAASCAPSYLVIEWGKSEQQRRPEQCANTFQQQLKQLCYKIGSVLVTNLKPRTL